MRKTLHLFIISCFLPFTIFAQTPLSRNLQPSDVYRLTNMGAPKISPEGSWILYNLSTVDSAKDKFSSKLFMVSDDGKETVTLTEQTKNVSNYKWSPDGKYISFLAAGAIAEEGSQFFLMDRRGGEPIQVSHIKGEIEAYKWLQEGKKVLFEIKDFNYSDTAKSKNRKPYEITRYKFKEDYEGYLDNRKTHLYLFDLTTKKLDTLTRGIFNETEADISSDGKLVTYASNTSASPDQNSNKEIFIVTIGSSATPIKLTNYKGADEYPQFSPDNKSIAFLRATSEDNYNMYDLRNIGVVDISTKLVNIITSKYDQSFSDLNWTVDSKNILALVEDDRNQNLVKVNAENGMLQLIENETGAYSAVHVNNKGKIVALFSSANLPEEIFIGEGNTFKRVTHVQDAFVAPFKQITVKGISAIASDNSKVNGILYLADSNAKKLPLLLFIHGGPYAQDDFSFDMTRQIYAAAGYAVAAVNYRGSSGRGANYAKCIQADWGNKEVKDIIAITNYLIKTGIADSTKLAIAGWSYGGILTNYTIATDHRFKAAISGAGSSLALSYYGSDQYITQYESELGKPWENLQKWLDLSYPFFKVKEIKTPTLFMASQADFNVPVIGAEQMYQAFKSVGIPTELILYPNQHHGIKVPSYLVHRYNSHINWLTTYLK
jgi:dipeptidyl aminopeptidase/acylaminoacyl peptidase